MIDNNSKTQEPILDTEGQKTVVEQKTNQQDSSAQSASSELKIEAPKPQARVGGTRQNNGNRYLTYKARLWSCLFFAFPCLLSLHPQCLKVNMEK